MDFTESRVIVGDLASAFSKRIGDAELQSWHRFCLSKWDFKRAQAAVRRIVETEDRFPSIAKFSEIAKAVRVGNEIGGAPLMVEVEDGVWRPLRDELAEMHELCPRSLPEMSEIDRRRSQQRLAAVMAEHFGRQIPSRSYALAKAAPDDIFEEDDPL